MLQNTEQWKRAKWQEEMMPRIGNAIKVLRKLYAKIKPELDRQRRECEVVISRRAYF